MEILRSATEAIQKGLGTYISIKNSMRTPDDAEIANATRLKEYIGSGAEGDCFLKDTPPGEPQVVVKIPHIKGMLWSTQGEMFVHKGLIAMDRNEDRMKRFEVTIKRDQTYILPDGTAKFVPLSTETPYFEGLDDKTVRYKHLQNTESIRAAMKYLEGGKEMYDEGQLGLDPYGAESMTDIMKGMGQTAALFIAKFAPGIISTQIESRVKGIEGRARNIMREPDEGVFTQTDHGFTDLSRTGKIKFAMEPINYLMNASFKELVLAANRRLPKDEQVPEAEIEAIEIHAPEEYRRIAKIFMSFMTPLFERYDRIAEEDKKGIIAERDPVIEFQRELVQQLLQVAFSA